MMFVLLTGNINSQLNDNSDYKALELGLAKILRALDLAFLNLTIHTSVEH